jgi:hypothetical protein
MTMASLERGDRFSIRLDLPLPAREARRRGLSLSLARLLLSVEGQPGGPERSLANLICASREFRNGLVVFAINAFKARSEVIESLGAAEVGELYGNEGLGITGEKALGIVMGQWDAEALVLVSRPRFQTLSPPPQPARRRKWWRYGCLPDYTWPWVEHIDDLQVVVSYSRSHSSLEALGCERAVMLLLEDVVGPRVA